MPRGKPQFIAWAALKEQFGGGLGQMNNFKRKFRIALGQVLAFYSRAPRHRRRSRFHAAQQPTTYR